MQAMEQEKVVFAVQFKPLLYKVCLALALPEPSVHKFDASGGRCEVCITMEDGLKIHRFSGRN